MRLFNGDLSASQKTKLTDWVISWILNEIFQQIYSTDLVHSYLFYVFGELLSSQGKFHIFTIIV